ncbi:tRNA synthetases class I, catalytic domain-containing protein [Limtongia smithiae]|uniref:tRNA synthetases class I, catalytic domain-containing protein n=1 Tax=Limtongia smithiae TaxID=1125753 RepID=UPI0034CFA4E3
MRAAAPPLRPLLVRFYCSSPHSAPPATPPITFARRQTKRKPLVSITTTTSTTHPTSRPDVQPTSPARTRFAPSPTGFIHLGSLRTALYNFLLARATGGTFILRLEDTDRTRLRPGAEQDIYDSLRWAKLQWDEGPDEVGGPYGPYRQSDRLDIYKSHAEKLVESGHAYRCFCTKERAELLRASATKLVPPSMATYDRFCYHLDADAVREKLDEGVPHTIRLKSPATYPKVHDLLHGELDLQVQVNYTDTRYDDPVLLKTDGFPTYHLASVVDDHLMHITHVIRGEEWLPSTPKHLALYDAFGWTPPTYTHIPLLTSLEDKKLSKRTGDVGIKEYAKSGIMPEALVNFVALFGWSPSTSTTSSTESREIMSMEQLIRSFSLNGLTKGNAKVSDSKLDFFNHHYLLEKLEKGGPAAILDAAKTVQPLVIAEFPDIATLEPHEHRFELPYIAGVIYLFRGKLHTLNDLPKVAAYAFTNTPDWNSPEATAYIKSLSSSATAGPEAVSVLEAFLMWYVPLKEVDAKGIEAQIKVIAKEKDVKQSVVFHVLRFAVAGSVPGAPLGQLIDLLDRDLVIMRLFSALRILKL